MKKIIIMFMAISMLLISCHMDAPIDNNVIAPTSDSNDDNGNETTDETDTTDDLNDDDKNDNTDETINYFELEKDETLNGFTYKVNLNGEYNATLTYDTSYHLVYGDGTNGIIDIELRNTNTEVTKVIFTNRDTLRKVHNVSVNGNVVTIELVDNN